MADNSNFILLWEIDSSTASNATRKMESKVHHGEGFKWTASFDRRIGTNWAIFSLHCGVDHNKSWKCDADVTLFGRKVDGTKWNGEKEFFSFNGENSSFAMAKTVSWEIFKNKEYIIQKMTIMEFHVRIVKSERGETVADPDKFAVPNRRSNVILKIGEKKLHVNNEFLAVHSLVFETMFFGHFAENGKEEVELKDVDYEEFLDLLHMLYSRAIEINDRKVQHILKLADQFQMECVLVESENHLIQSSGFNVVKKLLLADQYRLVSLKEHCLNSFTSVGGLIEKLESHPEYENFSAEMKSAIFDRIMKLKRP